MTVRVRKILDEIQTLSAEERKELNVSLQGGSVHESGPKYLSVEDAKPMIKEMLAEHSGLFKKLAQ